MVEVKKPVIEEGWYEVLKPEFESSYFAGIKSFLIEEKRQYVVYPPSPLIFNAFNRTPFDKVIFSTKWDTATTESAEHIQRIAHRHRDADSSQR